MKEMQLPNGETIFFIDKFTTEYVYNEIYLDNVYLQHGISIKDNDIIFDVGANMGIASLYFAQQAKNLQFFTFEPVPAIFKVLEANLARLIPYHRIKNYNIGLSDVSEITEIIYLPGDSGESTIIPFDTERKVQKMVEYYDQAVEPFNPLAKYVPKFLRKFFVRLKVKRLLQTGIKVPCQLQTLSEIIAENKIERIDLLKIDAENYESYVLAGIKDEDWTKIQQIAIEIHTHIPGGENLLQEITELFLSKGFSCHEGEESLETLWGVYMLYAKR